MKKCKHCQTEIDANAKICPNCRKKQGMPIWLIIILVIIGIGVISSIGSENSSSNNDNPSGVTNNTEKISLLDDYIGRVESEYSYEISGTLKNNTSTNYSYVQIEFYVYDEDGNMLDTCLGNNSGLEANGTWKFTASCFFTNGGSNKVASYKLKEITQW